MRKVFLFVVSCALSFQYASILSSLPLSYWLHYVQKPFVYRVLIPLLGQTPTGILVVVALFSMATAFVMLYIYREYFTQCIFNDVAYIASFFTLALVLTRFANYYDFASAFFFMVLLLLWMKRKFVMFVPVFILATLNRETTILILPVLFLVKRHWSLILSVVLYFAVRQMIVFSVGDAVGHSVYTQPMNNIVLHAIYWKETFLLLFFFSAVFMLFLAGFGKMRVEFFIFVVVLLPIFSMIYFVVGYAFEIRVFAEVLPLFLMGAFMKGESNDEKTKETPDLSNYWKENVRVA